MQQVYRSSQLAPKLQAERIRQQEAAKKGEPCHRRDIPLQDLGAPAEFLAFSAGKTGLHTEGLARTKFTQQLQSEPNVL